MLRTDCHQPYWKERFIVGLPILFAEKIKQKLRGMHHGVINYQHVSYGDLVSYICSEGLVLCTNLRLKAQMKKDKKLSKTKLGRFFEQFGIPPQLLHLLQGLKIIENNIKEELLVIVRKDILGLKNTLLPKKYS